MTDELDTLSDAELNGVFTREVAGYERGWSGTSGSQASDGWRFRDGDEWRFVFDHEAPDFATDVNAVLPYLEKHAEVSNVFEGGEWFVGIEEKPARPGSFVSGAAPTFARAVTIALIRAKRATSK